MNIISKILFPRRHEQYLRELLKSQIFHDTIVDSEWLKKKNFSPVGWAVDYGVLYTLFRVLDEMEPATILEFGLGQSSKMIYQYAAYFQNTKATTIEHDPKWIEFFTKQIHNSYPTNIQLTDIQEIEYKGHKTIVYKDLEEKLGTTKFDLILVDAPYGSDHYSRFQIVDIVPEHLNSSFCIIIDDYNRQGEKETAGELMKKLDAHNIKFEKAVYYGMKNHILICSENLKFLTTLS
jgi:predicted O-methyltransferase YrrM